MRKLGEITTVLFLVVALLIGLTSCGARSIRVPAEDLLIDDLSLFPTGWTIKSPPFSARDDLHVLMDQGAVDFAGVGFAPPNAKFGSPGASQIVWNFGSRLEAAWEFRRRFQPSDSSFSIEQLGEWAYHSDVADRFRVDCTMREQTFQMKIEGGWTDCEAIGQYGEYISVFGTAIGSEYDMTLGDFERVLRAIDERMAASLNVSYGYDDTANGNKGKGRRTSMTDQSGNASWQYDQRGRMTKETKVIGGAGGGTFITQWTYDAAERVKTMTYPDSEVMTYGYNPQGLLESMISSLGGGGVKYVESSGYDAMGRLTQRVMRNNPNVNTNYAWTTTFTYYAWTTANGWGRLQSIVTSGSLQNLSYTYDAVGNVKSIVDGANSSQKQCFNYDALDRLTQGFTGNSGCTAYVNTTGNGVFDEQYSYFANGNLDHKKVVAPTYQDDAYLYDAPVSGCTAGTPGTKPHAVRQAGSNTYSYDCNGNMTGRSIGATTPYTLSYDAENRLTQVQQSSMVQASFVYDGDGNRVMATVGSVTTLYPARHYEYVNGTTYTKYYYAGSDLVAFERSSGYGSTAGYGRRFVFRDHLNSTSVVVNGSNVTLWQDLYKPYGDLRYTYKSSSSLALQTQYRYISQRMEVGVGVLSPVGGLDRGLYSYGARWYDPSLARFIQPDTIVPEPGNPGSLNRYSYVLNNPLRYRDPSGHRECEDEECTSWVHPITGRTFRSLLRF